MLIDLFVKDFALIDALRINFTEHFNVLSGETGAGKSIIIDAVSLLLGARASSADIRKGADRAIVEGCFSANAEVRSIIEELGIDSEEEVLILRREISGNGKNICRINDNSVTLAKFKQVGNRLVNIYGQHDYQEITQAENQLPLLDSLGNEDYQQEIAVVAEKYHRLQACARRLKKLIAKEKEKTERILLLRQKAKELDALKGNLKEKELEEELQTLKNSAAVKESTLAGYYILYESENSVYSQLAEAKAALEKVGDFQGECGALYQRLESVYYEVEDIAHSLTEISTRYSENEKRREELEETLYLIQRLKRRYRCSLEELLAEKETIAKELAELEQLDDLLSECKQEYTELKIEFVEEAKVLSTQRKELAQVFSRELIRELQDLAMPNSRFEVAFEEELSVKGFDKVEFLFSANKGEDLKPLRTVASGGEMSRIMLAFKSLLATKNETETLIFDEIDTGIGGNVVVKVAEKLKAVSRWAQVICVTHAPQIAAMADGHFLIQKHEEADRTVSVVQKLDEEARIAEIARMLGGQEAYQIEAARAMRKQ